MLHLLCVPAGCDPSDLFYQKALQQELEDALLVASSAALVEKARMQGIRAATFDALANEVAEQCSAQLHDRLVVRKISRKAQELILQDIMERLMQEGRLPYFGRLAGKKGFVRSLVSLLEQIGSCGATPEEIETAFAYWDGRSPAYRQKDREVSEIYREYLAYLKQNNIHDMSGLYRVAAEELAALRKAGRVVTWKALYFTGFYRFDALQLMIIRLLSQICDVWIALPYESGRPDLYGAAEFTCGDLMQYARPERLPAVPVSHRTASLAHIVRNLRSPGKKPVPADQGIEIWQLSDGTEEMRAVLREIKQQLSSKTVKPSEVAVVVRRMEEYSGFRDLCDEYGIPVQAQDSAALAANPVLRFVSAALETVSLHGREQAERWAAFLTQPLQKIILGQSTEAAIWLARERYYTDYRKFLTDVLEKTRCEALQQLWQEIDAIPAEATIQEYCDMTGRLLSLTGLPEKAGRLYRDGQIPLAGFKNIVGACREIHILLQKLPQDYRFCKSGKQTVDCAGFAEALTEAAGNVSLSLQPENREGIAFLSAVNLEDAAFKQVYVPGLRENEFPFYKDENWIYNDSERADLAALGVPLPSSGDAYGEDIHFFMNACAAARERLVLTFYADEEHNASPYIAEIRSLFTDLAVQCKKTVTTVEDSLSREELELALARAGQKAALEKLEPGLAERAGSDRKRLQKEAGWNGNLEDDALLRQVSRQIGCRFSASKLETYRSCPFKFLVTYVWQQKAAEAAEEDMDPMQRGSLLHRVLEQFIRRHLGEKLQDAAPAVLQQELDGIFDTVCQEFADKGWLYAGDFWQHDKELQRILLHRWLRSEISYSGQGEWRPVYTEQAFGRNGSEEVALDIRGRRICLDGKIDRIDTDGSSFFITDYKSGDTPKKKDFADTDLQLPLYLLAAERFLAASSGNPADERNEKAAMSGSEGAVAASDGTVCGSEGAVSESDDAATRNRGRVAGGGYYSLKDGERKESFLFSAAAATVPWKTFSEVKDENGAAAAITDGKDLQAVVQRVLEGLLERMEQGDFTPTPSLKCDTFCPAAEVCRFRLLARDREEEDSNG